MIFTLAALIGAGFAGIVVGAGGYAAAVSKTKTDVKAAWAAVEAEFAKVSLTTAATNAVAAVKTAVAKL